MLSYLKKNSFPAQLRTKYVICTSIHTICTMYIYIYIFLQDLQDQNGYSLPKGPVFMSPKTFAEALVDAMSDPSKVKATKIQSVLNLFDIKQDVILGAYGNRNSDTKAYLEAGIHPNKIFIVNEKSVVRRVSDGKKMTYQDHVNNINNMYPKLNLTNKY